jgi:hypothetical protein
MSLPGSQRWGMCPKRSAADNAKISTCADWLWRRRNSLRFPQAGGEDILPLIGHSLCLEAGLYRESVSQTLLLEVQYPHVKCHHEGQFGGGRLATARAGGGDCEGG